MRLALLDTAMLVIAVIAVSVALGPIKQIINEMCLAKVGAISISDTT